MPTTVGAIFVSLSAVVKTDRLLTLYKSDPFSYEKAGFFNLVRNFLSYGKFLIQIMENFQTPGRGNRYMSWFLRILLLLVALFFTLFSFDVFSMDGSFLQKLGGFFIHNLFTIFMLLVLWLAWKRENLAGFLLFGMSLFMVFFFGGPSHIRGGTWMMISLPAIVGALFLGNYYLVRTK